MVYTIREISTDDATGSTYVLVELWRSSFDRTSNPNSPWLVNDFVLQLKTAGERYVTNETGQFKRKDNGQFETPAEDADLIQYERETFERSPRAEIEAAINAYMDRATSKGWRGDATAENNDPFFDGTKWVQTRKAPRLRSEDDVQGVLNKVRQEGLPVTPRLEGGR